MIVCMLPMSCDHSGSRYAMLSWCIVLLVIMVTYAVVGDVLRRNMVHRALRSNVVAAHNTRRVMKAAVLSMSVGIMCIMLQCTSVLIAPWGVLYCLSGVDESARFYMRLGQKCVVYLFVVTYVPVLVVIGRSLRGNMLRVPQDNGNSLRIPSLSAHISVNTQIFETPFSDSPVPTPRTPIQSNAPYWLTNERFFDTPYDVMRRAVNNLVLPDAYDSALSRRDSLESCRMSSVSEMTNNYSTLQLPRTSASLVQCLCHANANRRKRHMPVRRLSAGCIHIPALPLGRHIPTCTRRESEPSRNALTKVGDLSLRQATHSGKDPDPPRKHRAVTRNARPVQSNTSLSHYVCRDVHDPEMSSNDQPSDVCDDRISSGSLNKSLPDYLDACHLRRDLTGSHTVLSNVTEVSSTSGSTAATSSAGTTMTYHA